VLDKQRARFDLGTSGDKEFMLDTAQFVVFPKRFWQSDDGTVLHDFAEPLVTPPLGTGAYRVKDYAAGQFVILERVKDYWAADLPVNKGRYNFDTIRYDCYRDANVAFEAFKAGEYDFRNENSAKNWAVEYKGKVFETGAIVREELPHSIPSVMQALVFNTQRPIFADRRVRAALNYFFDFEWMNKNLFYNQYERSRSFFGNTDYEARGLPSLPEREILEPFRSRLPEEVFTREYRPPVSDGTGYVREGARAALKLFEEAGWQLKKGKLINNESGAQFSFELLIYDTSTERFAVPFQRVLSRYGIDMKIRMVDTSQYVNRLRSRDFDMLPSAYGANPYPSTNLMISWHSGYIESSYNTAGVIDPVVDNLIEQIMASQADEDKLLALGRALDRVLTWNYYVIPEWGISKFRIAYKNKLARPERRPKYALDIDSWWVK
jgi:microcin C transport system substrate-binding protein